MKNQNFWSSLRLALRLQQILGLSPFVICKNKLKSIWYISTFNIIRLIIVILATIWAFERMIRDGILKLTFSQGYLWGSLIIFEISFTVIGHIALICICEIKKNSKMEIFQMLYDIDEKLNNHFKKLSYRKHLWFNLASTIFIVSYYGLIRNKIIQKVKETPLFTVPNLIFINLYVYEQITASVESLAYNQFTHLIRERFIYISEIKLELSKQRYALSDELLIDKVAILLTIYKKLAHIVKYMNKNMGLLLAIRFTHDFTLTTSQLYIIFWAAIDHEYNNQFYIILAILYWMVQNTSKIIISCVSCYRAVLSVR